MLKTDWLSQVQKGNFETDLVRLVLSNGYGDRFEGHGHMTWSRVQGLTLRATTDGTEALLRKFGEQPCAPGEFFPERYYLRLEGTSRSGEVISAIRLTPDGWDIHANHPTVLWTFRQADVLGPVTISEPTGKTVWKDRSESLFTPGLAAYPKVSKVEDNNPVFGMQSIRRDWLEFDCEAGTVSARRVDSDFTRVLVRHRAGSSDPVGVEDAVGLAFSFLTGKPVRRIAGDSVRGGSRSRIVLPPPRRESRNRFPAPLGNGLSLGNQIEPLLSKATDYFGRPEGQEAGDLLIMCLESTDSPFTTHALVVCVALESLELVAKPC